MAVNRSNSNIGYGLTNALQNLAPLPIIADRAPTANDIAELGTNWIDTTNDAVYTITSVVAGAANWATAPSSGATTLASLVVTTTADIGTDMTVGGTLDVTGATTLGDLTATGTTVISGDLDLSSAALIDLTSTLDAAPSIYLHANGGTSEQILLRADQGTATDSVSLLSDVGGITLQATGLVGANAIDLNANSGGITLDSALALALTSTYNNAAAIVLSAGAGGIDILAGGAAAEDIDIVNTAGSVNINGGEAAVLNAVRIVASAADGGMDIDAGTGGITIDSTGAFSIDGAAASNVTTTGAGIDLTLSSVLGSVLVSSTEDAALAIRLHANGGTSETIQLHSDQGTGVGSINLLSDVGGITLTATGLASADAINLEATAGGVDVDAALQINIASSQNAADAIVVNASAGGIDITAAGAAGEDIDVVCTAGSVNITAGEAAGDAITIQASNAAGGIDISAGTGDLNLDSTGVVSIDAAAASNFTVTGAGLDLTLNSVGGSVLVSSTEDAALAVYLYANGGTSETIRLRADQGTGLNSIDLVSDVGGVRVTTGALAATTGLNLVQGAATASIQVGAGNPSHAAPQGSLYIKTDASTTTTRLWINTDGSTTWTYFTSNA